MSERDDCVTPGTRAEDVSGIGHCMAKGIALFESIHDKLTSSQNSSQKEKLEDALKKEIKKLQRSRDKIKGWASQNDIKDKKPLMDKRKQIETVGCGSSYCI